MSATKLCDVDLPLLVLAPGQVERVRRSLPELPAARRARFVSQYGLPAYDAGVLTQDADVTIYFEQVAAAAPASSGVNLGT
jgi:aspartyl-tRNA(Asn)/glutamyl-tRNA(Gln) amidotransferase subunit B